MRTIKLILFVEDSGHRLFLVPLIERIASEYSVEVDIDPRNVRGGAGKALAELKQFVRDFNRDRETLPDLLLVGRDANCKGYNQCLSQIKDAAKQYPSQIEYAIPDPHIERWLLLDPAAFKQVMGRGCSPPDHKCDRDRYKELWARAVLEAGKELDFGGLEYVSDIVGALDLDRIEAGADSLGKLIHSLRYRFRQCSIEAGGPGT